MKVKCDGREFEIKKDDNGKGFKKNSNSKCVQGGAA